MRRKPKGLTVVDDSKLFGVLREILITRSGRGLTQDEVTKIKSALAGEVLQAAPSRAGMGISKKGLDLIHEFESLRLLAYKDPGPTGLPITNGWGSTTDLQGRPLVLGTTWSKDYADAKFAQDIARFEIAVNLLLGGKPTTQNQFDALVSFAYNVGEDIDQDDKAEGLGDSTLLRKHLAGDYAGCAQEFAKWNKAKGQVLAGLTRRRAAEAARYLSA